MNSVNEDIPPGMTRPGPALIYREKRPTAPRMSMTTAVKRCLRKFDVFSGRARRAEYWKFLLAVLVGQLLLMVIYHMIFGPRLVLNTQSLSISRVYDGGWPATIYGILTFTPLLAAAWCRLHDTNKPGWLALIPASLLIATLAALFATARAAGGSIPLPGWAGRAMLGILIAFLLLIIQLARRGTAGPNRFGPDPLEVTQ